jgi:hypothetical protein
MFEISFNKENFIHEEINLTLTLANPSYHSAQKLFSQLLSQKFLLLFIR